MRTTEFPTTALIYYLNDENGYDGRQSPSEKFMKTRSSMTQYVFSVINNASSPFRLTIFLRTLKLKLTRFCKLRQTEMESSKLDEI